MRLCRLTFAPSANPLPSSSEKPIHLCMQSLHCLLWRVSETVAPKKTPLYEEHVRLGAKMVPFAGWVMPVQYTSIVEEHQAVRNNLGIFDISHMGQLIVDRAGAREWLNTLLTNNIGKLDVGMGQYSFLLNERGGIIDDLIVYRIDDLKFLLVVNAALEKGKPFGIKPSGLGARDTLRLEMCYPLNGSDLSPERNPIEAGLGFFVDLTKPNFIGRDVLVETKEKGPHKKLVPFRMKEKGPPPRAHYAVFENAERVGEVTSGTLSPSLNWGVGMAYVSTARAKIGARIDIEIRGQKFPAIIEKKPLYKKHECS